MILLATALLLAQGPGEPRAWLTDDSHVQFEEGSRIAGVMPSARNVVEY